MLVMLRAEHFSGEPDDENTPLVKPQKIMSAAHAVNNSQFAAEVEFCLSSISVFGGTESLAPAATRDRTQKINRYASRTRPATS